jgi:hypothetical protein
MKSAYGRRLTVNGEEKAFERYKNQISIACLVLGA